MSESEMQLLWRSSHISGGNAAYAEQLYEKYLRDPSQVSEEWRSYFDGLPVQEGNYSTDISHSTIREHFLLLAKNPSRSVPVPASSVSSDHERKQFAVSELINGYRRRGHLKAKLDPLELAQLQQVPRLTLEYHGLSAADLDTKFQTGNLFFGSSEGSLTDIIEALEKTYCGSVGAEYMHITDETEQMWVQQRMESTRSRADLTDEQKKRI